MATSAVEHQGVPDWGIDLSPENRPGVPKELPPHPLPHAHWARPAQQAAAVPVLKRADLATLTPVFGTATPPHGLSGEMRRLAYRIPDHRTSHWVILMAADRVDAVGSNLGGFLRRALPVVAAVALAGVALAEMRRRRLF